MIALLGTIGGAKGWEDLETYGVSHEGWLSSFLALPFGIPSADAYRRLFERISLTAFEQSFQSWLVGQLRRWLNFGLTHTSNKYSNHNNHRLALDNIPLSVSILCT